MIEKDKLFIADNGRRRRWPSRTPTSLAGRVAAGPAALRSARGLAPGRRYDSPLGTGQRVALLPATAGTAHTLPDPTRGRSACCRRCDGAPRGQRVCRRTRGAPRPGSGVGKPSVGHPPLHPEQRFDVVLPGLSAGDLVPGHAEPVEDGQQLLGAEDTPGAAGAHVWHRGSSGAPRPEASGASRPSAAPSWSCRAGRSGRPGGRR